MDAIDTRIERALGRHRWVEARRLIREALRRNPGHHWYLTRLATTYYEERKYGMALRFSRKAVKRVPHCPLVLWDYAGALYMTGGQQQAISIWRSLIRRGVENLARDECGEGVRWARGLVNDCYFRLAEAYKILGNRRLATRYMREHLANRGRGVASVFSRKEAVLLQSELENSAG